jgi:hypothetical protein
MLPLHVVASRCHPAVAAAALPHINALRHLSKSAAAAAAASSAAAQVTSSNSCSSGSGSSKTGSAAAAVAATAAAAAALGWGFATTPALADAVDSSEVDTSSSSSDAAAQAAKRERFAAWLTSHGGDVSAVAVQPSTVRGGVCRHRRHIDNSMHAMYVLGGASGEEG